MNVRKLSVNKACIFLAVLLLAAMVTVSVALYALTQDMPYLFVKSSVALNLS